MIKTNPLSIKAISQIAHEIRCKYNIPNFKAFPILDVLNHLMDKEELSIQVIEDSDPYLPADVPAVYNAADNFIYMKESVLTESEEGNYRANFTLAHEYFHFLQVNYLNFYFENVDYCKSYEEIEWQANEFAAELLLPEDYLEEDAEKLVERYHVSMECVLTRKVKRKQRLNRIN